MLTRAQAERALQDIADRSLVWMKDELQVVVDSRAKREHPGINFDLLAQCIEVFDEYPGEPGSWTPDWPATIAAYVACAEFAAPDPDTARALEMERDPNQLKML